MAENPYRSQLPDGSRVERNYRVEGGRRVGYGSWNWTVYDPDRRPSRKKVNLRTKDKGAAMGKALDYARRRSLGTFDPWADPSRKGATVDQASGAYLESQRKAGRAESTVATAERMLDGFSRSLPAGVLVRHVEPHHVEAFINAPKRGRKGKPSGPKSAGTKRRYAAVLKHFFSFCVDQGLADTSPAGAVRTPTPPPNRRDHLTEAEVAAVLRTIDAAEVTSGGSLAWLRDWVVFGVGTGLRPGEQRALRWSAVRLAERSVEVGKGHRTKTAGSVRTVPVRGAALDVLQRRASERTGEADGPVFAGERGGPVEPSYLRKRLRHNADLAKVQKTVTPYSLRHSFGTRLAMEGTPLYLIARLMGTSVQMVERHYAHYDPARGADHVERVFGGALGDVVARPPASG